MKFFKSKVWIALVFNLLLLVFVATTFKVDDMTLSKGQVYEFNKNWKMTWPNGESVTIESLP